MNEAEDCLRGVIADVRQAIDADDWTGAYVRLLKLNYCERAEGCANKELCQRVRDIFDRNIKRVTIARTTGR